ncbi:type II toxin-antitoxin system HicA family toxin [Candidatus Poribacteria bacterium]|nr:type II toxin-antitoxin system HicA family toxin [Candidatus Poribacteria bacterium]
MSPKLPALTSRQVIAALKKAGFYVHHQKGSHVTLKHIPDPVKRVTVPYHNRDLNRKTLATILDQAGLTDEEFVALL